MILIINNKPEPLEYFENYNTLCCNVEDLLGDRAFDLQRPLYFVSPANSLFFFDGGIDMSYSKMFPGLQNHMKSIINNDPSVPISLLGRKYCPIGGAVISKVKTDCYLIAAPTMLLPQNIKDTNNAYFAMKAVLKLWPGNGTLILPILGGGIGRMDIKDVQCQITKALSDYTGYITDKYVYLPNEAELEVIMSGQPRVYENSEFIKIDITQLKNTDVNK